MIESGENGLLVPINDADGLARAMTELARNQAQRARLAEAGFARYQAGFSESSVVAAYRNFIERVAR